jgi:ATP synthase protein I
MTYRRSGALDTKMRQLYVARDFEGSIFLGFPGLTGVRDAMRETESHDEEERVRQQSRILKDKIARAQGQFAAESAKVPRFGSEMTGMGRGMRLGTEFIAAILVGAVAGFLLDRWLNTAPWLMLVMLLIGFAAGVLNVVRAAGDLNRASPPSPGSDLGPGTDEED